MKRFLQFIIALLVASVLPAAQAAYLDGTVPQGSATPGQAGALMQSATSSVATPFATGTTNPLISMNASPLDNSSGLVVRTAPQLVWRTTFASATTNTADPNFWTLIQTGTGQALNQTGGNLVMTSGTTANAETIIRSLQTWNGSWNLEMASALSQRIANNNFYVELVDVIQDGASYSITNSTTVVVTFTANPFTSANVGQSMYLGAITGAAGIPMKGTIASVSGATVTYTVAGWPASGSGTLSVFGWNYERVLFTGVTATNANYDAQANGYPTGDTVATINTTAAPGTMIQITKDSGKSYMSDSLAASTLTPAFVVRASRFQNVPTQAANLYLQIRMTNGTSAPATTTTWTLNAIQMEDYPSLPVTIGPAKLLGSAGTPVIIGGGLLPTVTTVTGVTTVTTLTTLTTLANGQTAHSAASTGSPVRTGGRVNTTLDTSLVQGDASDIFVTTAGQQVVKEFGTAENDWQASSGTTPLATNTSTALKAAGAASIRNYVTAIQIYNTSATVSTTVSILDGVTVIWTGYVPATTTALPVVPIQVILPTPLKGTAATGMNIQCGTTGASVYYNVQGYQSF